MIVNDNVPIKVVRKLKVYFTDLTNDIINNDPYLFFTSKVKALDGQYKRFMHIHDDLVEVILVTSGAGDYLIDGRVYSVKKGDLIIFNSFVAHDEHLSQAHVVETYCCAIKGLQKNNLRKNALIPDNASPVFSLGTHFEDVNRFMGLIHSQLASNCKHKDIIAQKLFIIFLEYLEMNILNHVETYSSYDNEIILYRTKEYIEHYYYEPITLEDLAKMVRVSPYYLAHQFKKQFHCSPVKYLIKRRIGEAQTLLQNTNIKVTDIAYQVGFNSQSHFHTTFKKHVGVTPKQYRNEYKKNNEI